MLASLQSTFVRWSSSSDVPAYGRVLRSQLLSMLPTVIASVILPSWPCALAVILSVVLCYRMSAPFQASLFDLSLNRANVLIVMPLQLVFSAWGMLLLTLDRPGQLGASLFSSLLITFTAIAPLFRRARSTRTHRRLPYPVTFGVAAVGVLLIQIACLWVTP